MEYDRKRKCDVCGRGFTKASWEARHEFHDLDCPNYVNFDEKPESGQPLHTCNCDLASHPEHCPQCNPKVARRIRENQVLAEVKQS